MALPNQPVSVTPQQIAELDRKLANMRHNINNHLGLIVAACELIRVKPDAASRVLENMLAQPDKIINELRGFSDDLEKVLSITHDDDVGLPGH